ncbi:40S ribosomal protein S12 [Trypanosoma equiperdum]|uniref:Small ribosomal subunit protein eS12 n=6 Tax=Eukaryota TaxID=2759 RepID=RS12_TRYBB|nr:40S ribosomal protein S12, putative [Trypanosoma brucei gambiense DAL972]XP_828505.1 40S ribosomal protein S12 [Trypanosoma brucei brucei TREU927]Q03253.2 RecName: Full=Small ribosomal subunit protein eS12; AltName: Full=40S ribosomal protein S12 [Trypanosoma brucei brucei]4V8M_AF Chain AF, 40S RIBOSOMAL PROTEIN S12 [Trypanosoma brucei brucei TREU927]8OVA_AF Chain AF, 40S ribosomal protein S12 [Trypanosoma brucei brucei]RHW67025.1 40S ribosomal protein S12 [Trypanosoma brucei equiperdum]CA|eukprot:XP_011779637.1 40S ribosomal protein S12, putative [Trypanosoma brucei gambiense DAL972]
MAEETSLVADKVPEPAVIDAVADAMPDSLEDALRIVLMKARETNGLICGLSEVTRALDRRTAHLCVLADDCEDEEYKKLVTALAKQNNIDLVSMDEREKLAQWAGLTRMAADGSVRKTLKCSCLAVRDFGERTKALDYLLSQLQ